MRATIGSLPLVIRNRPLFPISLINSCEFGHESLYIYIQHDSIFAMESHVDAKFMAEFRTLRAKPLWRICFVGRHPRSTSSVNPVLLLNLY